MYDLRASHLKKVLPKSTTWRTALILSQAGMQYSEYSRNKPKGADPRTDFPGFDLDKIAQDIKAYLGDDARGVRSKGEEYNEVLGHLWYLTTKKSFPGGHPIVAYRADASTEERKVFTLGKLGDDLHRALEGGGHYPFLLSMHSKDYWEAILVLGALKAGLALKMDEIVSFTGMKPSQIKNGMEWFSSGFLAKSSTGETREYVGTIKEKLGVFRLPPDLMLAEDSGADDLDKLEVLPRAQKVESKANGGTRIVEKTPQGESIGLVGGEWPPVDAPVVLLKKDDKVPFQVWAESQTVFMLPIQGEDAQLIKNEAKVRGVTPEELMKDLLAPRFAEIRPMLREMAKQRENDSKSKLAVFEAEKARLEAEHQSKLNELAKSMGIASV